MYDGVAAFYDRYTADIRYDRIADFAEHCFRRFGNAGIAELAGRRRNGKKDGGAGVQQQEQPQPRQDGARPNGEDIPRSTLVLDCACGTGTLTRLLAARGYDMTGADISPEMLQTAAENAAGSGSRILWLCQDMRKIDLYGSYAAVLCMTDGINHLVTEKQLGAFFGRIYHFIDSGGLLIFDFLTPCHFEKKVGNNVFFEDREDGSCLWTSRYHPKSGRCVYEILLYAALPEDPELYTRSSDRICEKAWTPETATRLLLQNGFELCGLYGGLSLSPVKETTGRVYAVARRPSYR